MDTKDWQRVNKIVVDALDIDEADRGVFLDERCADSPEVRREAESLLAAESASAEFLESPAIKNYADFFNQEDEPEALIGQKVGNYRIISELGHGGMGAVYLAERSDGKFEQRVALKLLKREMNTTALRKHFQQERSILATLKHPNIARLLDAGTTRDRIPFLVMEFVEGLPIDEYCSLNDMSLNDRLDLFRNVCSAVDFAHRNLIIHRDLKPSNIMVTTNGTPILLDFGISKILSEKLEDTDSRTITRMGVMTPSYASPEQLKNESVATATDVYSLGVILYQLLSGRRPFQDKESNITDIFRAVIETDPKPPSTITAEGAYPRTKSRNGRAHTLANAAPETTPKIRAIKPQLLRGDLDNIVLKALKKEPEQRYSSVEKLSEDIHRHQSGLPVIARPDTFGYRAQKFIKRHRAAVLAGSLVFVALFAGLLTTLWQARAASAERDKARIEAQKSARINSFIQSVFGSADPRQLGRDVKVVDTLDDAVTRAQAELADQPEVLAGVLRTIGNSYRGIGLFDRAEPQLRTALALNEQTLGEGHLETARSIRDMGMLLRHTGDYVNAASYFERALAIMRKNTTDSERDMVETLLESAANYVYKGDTEAAVPFIQEGYDLSLKVYGEKSFFTSVMLNLFGLVREYDGDLIGAESFFQRSVAICRGLPDKNRSECSAHLMNLGTNLTTRKEYEAAEAVFQESLEQSRTRFGNEHPSTASVLTHLGRMLMLKGDLARSEQTLRDALGIYRRTLPVGHAEIPQTTSLLGLVLTRQGKAKEGESFMREAIDIRRRILPADHWLIANNESQLGECLMQQRRYGEAESLMVKGLEGLKSKLGETHPRTLEASERLIKLYAVRNKPGVK